MPAKPPPRYRSIANVLIDAIVARRYPVGSSLPAEAELCQQMQASRHTVREALRILEDSGMISRRQGSGSEVLADTPPVRYRQTVDTIEDLLQYGAESRLALLVAQERPVPADVARHFGCAAGVPCIQLQGLRSERQAGAGERAPPGDPFAVTHIWFPPQQPPRRRDKLLSADTSLASMFSVIDARTLGHIEQAFTAEALAADTAALLGVKKGAPTLRVDRAYFDRRNSLLLVATSWHRADRYRYATVLRHVSAS
jgi:GntR family transcriptional regulator